MGVTVIASEMLAALAELVAVNDGREVTPFCPVPTPVPLLVVGAQLKVNTPPVMLLVVSRVIAACVPLRQDVVTAGTGAVTCRVGFTVTVTVNGLPAQPADEGT